MPREPPRRTPGPEGENKPPQSLSRSWPLGEACVGTRRPPARAAFLISGHIPDWGHMSSPAQNMLSFGFDRGGAGPEAAALSFPAEVGVSVTPVVNQLKESCNLSSSLPVN